MRQHCLGAIQGKEQKVLGDHRTPGGWLWFWRNDLVDIQHFDLRTVSGFVELIPFIFSPPSGQLEELRSSKGEAFLW